MVNLTSFIDKGKSCEMAELYDLAKDVGFLGIKRIVKHR
jgi:hypothetical protein